MQKIIRESFATHTIVAIAHRLDTVLDYDRIVVLDHGRIVEDGPPQDLLQRPDGNFRELYEAYKNDGVERT